MGVFKGALRQVVRKKVETVSIILLIFIVILSYGSLVILAENMSDHAYRQFRAVIGDVAIFGVFPNDFIPLVKDFDDISVVKTYKVWFGDLDVNGSKYSISLTDDRYVEPLTVFDLNGSMPNEEGEAVFYYALTGVEPGGELLLDIGDEAVVYVVTPDGEERSIPIKIVGTARGFAHLGGMSQSIIVTRDVIDDIVGDRWIVVGVYVEPGSVDLDELADRLEALVDEEGYLHFFTLVNKKETNPVVVLLESASTILTIPISIVIGLIPLLVASAGSTTVIREVKIIATLKAIGSPNTWIFRYYSLPWIVRGGIGTALGVLAAPYSAEYIYVNFIVRDSEIADILISTLGFNVSNEVILSITTLVMGAVVIGALIPYAIAVSVRIVSAISSTGLYSIRTPVKLSVGGSFTRLVIRELFTRPWKLVGIFLSIVILWGAVTALNMEANGLNGIIDTYRYDLDFDVNIFVSTTSRVSIEGLSRQISEEISSIDGIRDYFMIDREIFIDMFGLVEVGQVIAGLQGDPTIAFPLDRGRYPDRLGEAVISRSLSILKNVDIGDSIEVSIDGAIYTLEIVGISISRLNNGFYLLVTPEQLSIMADIDEELGSRGVVIYLDVESDVEEVSEKVKMVLEENPLLSVDYTTKDEIIDNIMFMMNFILGLNAGIIFSLLLASLISLSSIYSVDSEAKSKELAIVKALGVPNIYSAFGGVIQLAILIPFAAPPSLLMGMIIADLISRSGATAIGYVEPMKPISSLLSPNMIIVFLVVMGIVLIVNYVKTRRLDVIRVIQEI